MLAGAFAGIAVRNVSELCHQAGGLTSAKEHTVMYPVDLLKVCSVSPAL